jgi:hypothetical protein
VIQNPDLFLFHERKREGKMKPFGYQNDQNLMRIKAISKEKLGLKEYKLFVWLMLEC